MATRLRDRTIPLGFSCYPALRPDNFHDYVRHLPRAPSPARGVTPCGVTSRPHRKALPFPHRYSELMRQTQFLPRPRSSLVPRVYAGCCESLLEEGPSRRYLCTSFLACKDPYPGCSCGARARYFPQNDGLPGDSSRSAHCKTHAIATSACKRFRGYNHSLMFKPANLLATLVAPTTANILG
jgi:hypothetical protein